MLNKWIYYLPHEIIYNSYKFLFRKKFKKHQLRREKIATSRQNSLKGFDERKCIFIHIPKVAGVSLSLNLFGNLGGGHRPIYSYYTIFSPKEFDEYFKFTIVRNPWDRLVSAYFFLKEGGFNNTDRIWFDNNLKRYPDFQDFVLKWVNKKNIYRYTHFIPQHYYISLSNKILVDKVYRFEEMPTVIDDISNRLNIDLEMTHENKTEMRCEGYRSYYNDETKEIVKKTYKKDIELFNYSF